MCWIQLSTTLQQLSDLMAHGSRAFKLNLLCACFAEQSWRPDLTDHTCSAMLTCACRMIPAHLRPGRRATFLQEMRTQLTMQPHKSYTGSLPR